MKAKSIEKMISGHQIRDASLRRVFLEKKIDLTEPRTIECHFWAWDEEDASRIANALKGRGFEILIQRSAAVMNDPSRWNVEAAIRQSIDLTMRREFIDELVRLADSNDGIYDGWGTRI